MSEVQRSTEKPTSVFKVGEQIADIGINTSGFPKQHLQDIVGLELPIHDVETLVGIPVWVKVKVLDIVEALLETPDMQMQAEWWGGLNCGLTGSPAHASIEEVTVLLPVDGGDISFGENHGD